MIRSLEPLDIFGCIQPSPPQTVASHWCSPVHQLPHPTDATPHKPLAAYCPPQGWFSNPYANRRPHIFPYLAQSVPLPLLLHWRRCCSSVSSGLLNEVKTSRLSPNVQFWLNLGERGGWMFVFSGLAHSHDNGLSVATFPPTAPPQDMLTRRGWWIVCTELVTMLVIETADKC